MITVDISNIWGEISLPDLLALEKEISAAHMVLTGEDRPEPMGWLHPEDREVERLCAAAQRIRKSSDVFVVVGTGSLGSKAAIDLLLGEQYNLTHGKPQIFFVGTNLSSRSWNRLEKLLEGKDFSVALISKSGATLEPAVAARALRWMLERRYGTDGARRRIFAVTDPFRGPLRQQAEAAGWETFSIPQNVSSFFTVLTPAGLLPMAVAGIDIRAVLAGAWEAEKEYDLRSFENPVWLYSAVRNLLHRKGKAVELLEGFDPAFDSFGAWWQQLFGQAEGKKGKGLLPVPAQLPLALHTLGQTIQEGSKNLFETMVRIAPPEKGCTVVSDHKNLDGLNYLAGQTLDWVDEQVYQGALAAHVDGGVSVITLDVGELGPEKLGEMFYFFQLSCALSATVLGVNPFRQPGVEAYKSQMYRLLGKPGCEN